MASPKGVLKFMFLGDATNLNKAAGDADKSVSKLGDTTERTSKHFSGSVDDMADSLKNSLGPAGAAAGGAIDDLAGGLKSMSPAAMVAGGAATAAAAGIVAFGVSSINAFQDAAAGIKAFQDVTGASAEDASRLLAMADDLNISSETLGKTMGKMAVEIGKNPEKFSELGVEVVKAADGSVVMSDTLVNVAEHLNGIKDPAERARQGAQLLGRGWQTLSPIISRSREELQAFFDEADRKGEVLTQDDIDAAEDFRLAIKDVKEAFGGLQMQLGAELVPELSNYINLMVKAEDATSVAGRGIMGWAKEASKSMVQVLPGMSLVVQATDHLGESTKDAAEEQASATQIMEEAEAAAESLAVEEKNLADEIKNLERADRDALSAYEARIDAINANLDAPLRLAAAERAVERAMIDERTATEDLRKAYEDTTLTGDQLRLKELEMVEAQDKVKTSLYEQAAASAEVRIKQQEANGVSVTAAEKAAVQRDELDKLRSKMEPGSALWHALSTMIGQLDAIPRHIPVTVTLSQAGISPGVIASARAQMQGIGRAAGGPVQAGQMYRVNEQGTAGRMNEYFQPNVDGEIKQGRPSGGGGLTIQNLTVGSVHDAAAMRDALDWLLRTGGK